MFLYPQMDKLMGQTAAVPRSPANPAVSVTPMKPADKTKLVSSSVCVICMKEKNKMGEVEKCIRCNDCRRESKLGRQYTPLYSYTC